MVAKDGTGPAFRDQDEVFQVYCCRRWRVVICGWERGGIGVRWQERGGEQHISENSTTLFCCLLDETLSLYSHIQK